MNDVSSMMRTSCLFLYNPETPRLCAFTNNHGGPIARTAQTPTFKVNECPVSCLIPTVKDFFYFSPIRYLEKNISSLWNHKFNNYIYVHFIRI